MLVDWTYAPPGWIEQHLKYHGGTPTYVIGPYLYHTVGINRALYERLVKEMPGAVHRPWAAYEQQPKLRLRQPFDLTTQDARADASSIEEDAVLRGEIFDEVSAFEEGPFDPAWLERMPPLPEGDPGARGHLVPGPVAYTNAHLKNESVPRILRPERRGRVERAGGMCIDTDLGRRVSAVGSVLLGPGDGPLRQPAPRRMPRMPFGLVDDRGGALELGGLRGVLRAPEARSRRYVRPGTGPVCLARVGREARALAHGGRDRPRRSTSPTGSSSAATSSPTPLCRDRRPHSHPGRIGLGRPEDRPGGGVGPAAPKG